MSVLVDFRGNLGNNLFQYALGRIVAKTNGLALTCVRTVPTAGAPPDRSVTHLEDWTGMFSNAPMQVSGVHVLSPTLSYETWPNSPWRGHRVDLTRLLHAGKCHIRLRGYFQRYEYYEPYMPIIRQWYEVTTATVATMPCRRDVVVNIRRGPDFAARGWTLPTGYYRAVLSSVSDIGRVIACGTGIDARLREALAQWSPVYAMGGPVEDFALMRAANRLVVSNSTFAWWAAALSTADEIYLPRTNDPLRYAFGGYRDVSLIPNEPQYRPVTVDWQTY